MKISLIKSKKDRDSFRTWKGLGFEVVELEDLEKTDIEIENLVENKYHTIILTTEVAGFSENIFKKYQKSEDVRIIIAPNKRK